MTRKVRNLLIALLPLCLVGALIIAALINSRGVSRPPLPNPNGYDDFLNAATLMTGGVATSATLDQEGLRRLNEANTNALRRLRLGLSRSCSVPTESAISNLNAMFGDLAKLKSLARLLVEEGRLAELENRPEDAARSYVDAIQFGNEISHGGFLLHRLVGVASEAIGAAPLFRLVPKFSCEQTRPLSLSLEKVEQTRVSWEEISQNESLFARKSTGNPLARMTGWWMARTARKKGEEKHQRTVAHLRLLLTELALRCYRAETGRGPERLEQLIPKHLTKAPIDPFTGKMLVYRTQGTNWLLYSVGIDRVDDGGVPVGPYSSGTTKGDLLFDSQW